MVREVKGIIDSGKFDFIVVESNVLAGEIESDASFFVECKDGAKPDSGVRMGCSDFTISFEKGCKDADVGLMLSHAHSTRKGKRCAQKKKKSGKN